LNAILRRLVSEGGRPRRRQSDARVRIRELMGETRVGAVLQFPPMKLRARELATLRPGSVLRLSLPKHEVAELRIGGLVLAPAHPVSIGEHRGAQIEARGVLAIHPGTQPGAQPGAQSGAGA
jgi:flagellar motor switch protein FliM